MEKLKPIHKHDLTNIIKVGMFALMLLLPFLVFLPNAFYYGFNEHANTQTKTIETKENILVNFNQQLGQPTESNFYTWNDTYITFEHQGNTGQQVYIYNLIGLDNHIIYFKLGRSDTFESPGATYQVYWQASNSSYYGIAYTTNYYYGEYSNPSGNIQLRVYGNDIVGKSLSFQLFDLTLMYGAGNEPTRQEFDQIFINAYYPYTQNELKEITKTTGTETIIDIPFQMNYAWQQTWELPLFNWTSNSILNTGLTAFANGLGIVSTSYIPNFLTYELVIVAIYIVLDIVLTLFTWLTHIGQKD